mgnify:CR=1 FL=1
MSKEVTIDGVKVRYLEIPGPIVSRFKVSMLIEGVHVEDTLICTPTALKEELEELVFVNKIRRNRK